MIGLRKIKHKYDCVCIFKNLRNFSEIRTLTKYMASRNMILIQIYMEATKGTFRYLFINLTQKCDPKFKYLSYLFDIIWRINVYIVEGQRYRKDVGYDNFDANVFKNNNMQPYQEMSYNHIISQPRLSNMTHI